MLADLIPGIAFHSISAPSPSLPERAVSHPAQKPTTYEILPSMFALIRIYGKGPINPRIAWCRTQQAVSRGSEHRAKKTIAPIRPRVVVKTRGRSAEHPGATNGGQKRRVQPQVCRSKTLPADPATACRYYFQTCFIAFVILRQMSLPAPPILKIPTQWNSALLASSVQYYLTPIQ